MMLAKGKPLIKQKITRLNYDLDLMSQNNQRAIQNAHISLAWHLHLYNFS